MNKLKTLYENKDIDKNEYIALTELYIISLLRELIGFDRDITILLNNEKYIENKARV
jgi:hypothetical protein